MTSAPVQKGYIPDICRLLQKYSLMDHVYQHIFSGVQFPSKYKWKRIVKTVISEYEQTEFISRISNDSDFCIFRNLHQRVHTPAMVWQLPKTYTELKLCDTIAKLWIRVPDKNISICEYCEAICQDRLVHTLTACPVSTIYRDILLRETTVHDQHVMLENIFDMSDEITMLQMLLGTCTQQENTCDMYHHDFLIRMFRYVSHVYSNFYKYM